MELTYRLTFDDWRKFNKLARARVISQASAWKQVAGALPVALILPTVAALVLLRESGLIDRRAAGAVSVAYVWGIASWVIANWLAGRQLRAIWPKGGWLLSEQRLTVDGDGVTSEAIRKGCTSSTRYSWRAFSDLSEQAGLILLWLGDGADSLVVPARALADEAARRDFVTLVRERIAAVKPLSAGDRNAPGYRQLPAKVDQQFARKLWGCPESRLEELSFRTNR